MDVGDMSEIQLSERQKRLLHIVKDAPAITAMRMSETLSVSQRTIERDFAVLKKMEIIKREGKDNDGKWVILV